jgi:hypothetical protein
MARNDSPGFAGAFPTAPAGYNARQRTAPGTAGATVGETGPVVGTAVVSNDNSSQPGFPVLQVTAGETSNQPDDVGVPTRLLAPADGADVTGAGEGKAGHFGHPNNGE